MNDNQEELVATCPVCACPDLQVAAVVQSGEEGRKAQCPVCNWTGTESQVVMAPRRDRWAWTAEAAGERLLRVFHHTGMASALVRALQTSAILPEFISLEGVHDPALKEVLDRVNASVQEAIDETMRAGMHTFISTAFEEAIKQAVRHQEIVDQARASQPADKFTKDRVFGGDVE
jgi:hypothetical protein